MEYEEITVSTTTRGAEPVSDCLMQCGAAGTQIIDRADLPDVDHPVHDWELMDESLILSMPEDVQVKAWFLREELPTVLEKLRAMLSARKAAAAFDMGTLAVSMKAVRDSDWNEVWKQYYKTLRIGRRLVIKPTWETYTPARDDLVIEMDPGMAFGTGTHETTALCAEMIEKYYKGGTLLDIGTGSGILAICAAKLGAEKVVGVDIDEDAVRVALENVKNNGLTDIIDIRKGDLIQGLHEKFDFAAANILYPILIKLLPVLGAHLRSGSYAVLSGILVQQEQDIVDFSLSNGYEVAERVQKGDWACVVLRKP